MMVLIIYPSGDEQGWVMCPWCKRGRIMTDKLADANVTTYCSFCKKLYTVNLRTLRATKTKAAIVNKKIETYSKTEN